MGRIQLRMKLVRWQRVCIPPVQIKLNTTIQGRLRIFAEVLGLSFLKLTRKEIISGIWLVNRSTKMIKSQISDGLWWIWVPQVNRDSIADIAYSQSGKVSSAILFGNTNVLRSYEESTRKLTSLSIIPFGKRKELAADSHLYIYNSYDNLSKIFLPTSGSSAVRSYDYTADTLQRLKRYPIGKITKEIEFSSDLVTPPEDLSTNLFVGKNQSKQHEYKFGWSGKLFEVKTPEQKITLGYDADGDQLFEQKKKV